MVKDFRLKSKKTPIVRLGIKDGNVKAKIFKSKSSRSQKDRWDLAREKKSVWEKYNPKSEFSLSEFAKRDNVLDRNIEIYDMSVQVNYSSKNGGLNIGSQTFQVIAFKGLETSNAIDKTIKNSYENMIFTGTGDTFNPGFQSAISRNTKINTNEIRGLEKSENVRLSKDDYIKLNMGNFIVKDLNPNLKATKNKNNDKKGNEFRVKLDLTEFM